MDHGTLFVDICNSYRHSLGGGHSKLFRAIDTCKRRVARMLFASSKLSQFKRFLGLRFNSKVIKRSLVARNSNQMRFASTVKVFLVC
jgi:hypothetical protein